MDRVCVIGAGSSGLAACQVLHARRVPFDCFEAGSAVGGNWRYGNDSGMSSAFRSMHAKSSRRCMQYAAFPMPADYPDYLSHELMTKYLDDFADHFGFRDAIRFRTQVTRAEPTRGGWKICVRDRDTGSEHTAHYRAVLVASGHHWDPLYPVLPGTATFSGEQIHSHYYRTPERFTGQRVLVLGIGNSACDVATDCSAVAARTLLAVRRGTHIVPKYIFGMPTDWLTQLRVGAWTPLWLQRSAVGLLLRCARGKVTRYGLPQPDQRLLSVPPTVSDSLLSQLDRGDIVVKPGIGRFEGDRVRFTDGSSEPVDVVIYGTGYKISFPFLDRAVVEAAAGAGAAGGEFALYRRIVSPALPGLYFIGLVQPFGPLMPIVEAQSHWVADLLQGNAALPPRAVMDLEIARYHAVTAKRYARSSQPHIQVDYQAYLREIRAERRAGARRNKWPARHRGTTRIAPGRPATSAAGGRAGLPALL